MEEENHEEVRMNRNTKSKPALNSKIAQRIFAHPPIQADDLIDLHFLLQKLTTQQLIELFESGTPWEDFKEMN